MAAIKAMICDMMLKAFIKCQPSVMKTNTVELKKNFSPKRLLPCAHLRVQLCDPQKLKGSMMLNLRCKLPDNWASANALDRPMMNAQMISVAIAITIDILLCIDIQSRSEINPRFHR